MDTAPSGGWTGVWSAVPLAVEVDLDAGGRWTSLRGGRREWLWHHPDPAVQGARRAAGPGDPFVDAGGGEECLPTVGGLPDHGALWTAPWSGTSDDASATTDGWHLRRRIAHTGGAVRIDLAVAGAPGRALLHAVHLLLDTSAEARLELPAAEGRPCRVDDEVGTAGRRTGTWPPRVSARRADRLGPDDGSAVLVMVPGVQEAVVVDGDDALRLTWAVPAGQPTGVLLWRNLCGWPSAGPYRTTGVEPLLGSASDLSACAGTAERTRGEAAQDDEDEDGGRVRERAAVLGPGGVLAWTLELTAWRRRAPSDRPGAGRERPFPSTGGAPSVSDMLTAEPGSAPAAANGPTGAPEPLAPLDLAGEWSLALDRDGVGEAEGWWRGELPPERVEGRLELPGSLTERGFGDPVTVDTPWTGQVVDHAFTTDERYAPYRTPGAVSVPYWLQPRTYYRGAAWYQRVVVVPESWRGLRAVLELERVHWESTLWVDGVRASTRDSLVAPHRHVVGPLEPGPHRLTLRVDNRTVVEVGPNAHSASDHTQGNWNGAIGRMLLHAVPEVRVQRLRVVPRVAERAITVRVDIASGPQGAGPGRLVLSARRRDRSGADPAPLVVPFTLDGDLDPRGLVASGGHLDVDYALGARAELWSEHHPAVYDLTARLETAGGEHELTTAFGLREVGVEGTQITVNGVRTFLRGTLESCVHPLTGHPPTDVASWRRIVDVCRAHGLNLLRFHSWCPPEAAFDAADEAGLYLQVEGPVWANQGAAVGEGRPLDAFLHAETQRVIDEHGNHPSFIAMAHGNEPSGRDAEFLADWVSTWRRRDPRRLYTSAAGWPAIPENDFDNVPGPRLHQWGDGLASRLNASPPETESDYSAWTGEGARPVVSHEIGQWCAYPSFAEVEKYTGLLRPRNFGVFADFLAQGGMADQAEAFLAASGALQRLCYTEEVEAALRTPGFAGFHLLGLNDFPGQGTALVGVLDAFWEPKGYCTPEDFSRSCGPTVPLARLPRRVWAPGEELVFEPQVAHFGAGALHAELLWRLLDAGGRELAAGGLPPHEVPVGNERRYEAVDLRVPELTSAQRVRLELTVREVGGPLERTNHWDLWVFPDEPSTPGAPAGVAVTRDPSDAVTRAAAGETVVLVPSPERLRDDVVLGFTPVFWNTAWTKNQPPHTLGVLHDPEHPLFDRFPSDGHTDWQWWELLHRGRAMVLDALPPRVRAVVQPIDTWFEARRLGAVVELGVGEGRLVVCSLDVADAPAEHRAARAFWRCLLAYAAGPPASAPVVVEEGRVRSWLEGIAAG